MISDVQKDDLVFFLTEKLKQNSVPLVNRKTPLFFEFTVQTMRFKTGSKRVAPENLNALIDKPLQLRI
ncbi:MAG: hypothetical protein Q7S08_00275 [bacterium]|nr:hypothetical protein [bacterium]